MTAEAFCLSDFRIFTLKIAILLRGIFLNLLIFPLFYAII
nr:MAG TPA: hypothetical protein [Bacteriophage sp.]